ncbi:MAG: DUF4270 domain-containing protein [Prevotellaceae bacterium]|nr:DUF4270 domain-containing protein [Prevotellaceae bacterium]
MGSGWLSTNLKTVYIDTCSVTLATMKVDSVQTNNQSVMLVGRYRDVNAYSGSQLAGTITATSFAEIQRADAVSEIANNAEFDSIVVEMRFSGTYAGDTTKNMHLKIFHLAERINNEASEVQSFYNTNSFRTEDAPLAEAEFPVRPHNTNWTTTGGIPVEPVRIKLPDSIGIDLFDKIRKGTEEVTNADNFAKYFKGFAFKAGDGVNQIVGLKADSTFKMILHYHIREDFVVNRTLSFSINTARQFNNIAADRSETPLEFTPLDKEIPASSSGNQAYLAAGDGLYVKADFPTIPDLARLSDYGSVERAVLELKPVVGTYETVPLPRTLNVYAVSESGESESILNDAQNIPLTGNLVEDFMSREKTYYSFDITSFVQNQVFAQANQKMYLAIRLPMSDMQKTVARLALGDSSHSLQIGTQYASNKAVLKLYYNMYNEPR